MHLNSKNYLIFNTLENFFSIRLIRKEKEMVTYESIGCLRIKLTFLPIVIVPISCSKTMALAPLILVPFTDSSRPVFN